MAENGASWQLYSTSRFLEGSEPNILSAVEVSGPTADSEINVELVPERLTTRWKDMGLRFATESHMNDIAFVDTLVKSLELAHRVKAIQGTIAGMCRSLHALLADNSDFDTGFSEPTLPFSIFVSCPPLKERNRVERLAENIVHEALHLQLSLVEKVEPLVADTSPDRMIFSPWKGEERTLHGLVHAVYVFGNLRYFWNSIPVNTPQSLRFARTRVKTIDHEIRVARNLLKKQPLTTTGHQLVTSVFNSIKHP